MLCCSVVLRCVVPYVVLCCTELSCAGLLCCVVLYCVIVLCFVVLLYFVVLCLVLYCAVLNCFVLVCNVVLCCCVVVCCFVLCCNVSIVVLPCAVLCCLILWYRALLGCVVLCCAMLCRVMTITTDLKQSAKNYAICPSRSDLGTKRRTTNIIPKFLSNDMSQQRQTHLYPAGEIRYKESHRYKVDSWRDYSLQRVACQQHCILDKKAVNAPNVADDCRWLSWPAWIWYMPTRYC